MNNTIIITVFNDGKEKKKNMDDCTTYVPFRSIEDMGIENINS